MKIQEAYDAGKKIRDAINNNNGDIAKEAQSLEAVSNDKTKLCDAYLKLCVRYNISNNNDFIIEMLDEKYLPEVVMRNLLLGIISADEGISFVEAAKKWEIDRTTIQKAKTDGRLKENECWKIGRNSYVSLSAMKRIFGDK